MKEKELTVIFRIEIAMLLDHKGVISSEKTDRLVMLISSLQNSGIKTIIVSSGAIVLGSEKLGMKNVPDNLPDKQAAAAVGQAELISCYQACFDCYDQVSAQVLLTSDIVNYPERSENARNAFKALLEMNIIPIVNENDPVSTCDIDLDDNYPLALIVAEIVSADFIVVKMDKGSKYLIVPGSNFPSRIVDAEKGMAFDLAEIYNQIATAGCEIYKFPASLDDIMVA